MTNAAITGWGTGIPEKVVTNAELARTIPGIDEEWIVRRSGIRQRHIVATGESTSTLAIQAGREAIADVDPLTVDLVIVATCTPDRPIPGIAPAVATALNATNAGAFDVNAACAGFLTAYAIADSMIRAHTATRVLVIGAEVMSRVVDWNDPKTCVLFGDGAGAVLLEASDEPAGLRAITMGADGTGADLISIPAGDTFVRMNGPEVYRAAVRIMEAGARGAMTAAGFDTPDLLIAHQANQRIIDEVGERLGLRQDKVFSNVARFGNTSAASIPIALSEAAREGRLYPGARFVLTAVGAGLTWAAGAATWTGTRQEPKQLEAIGAHV